MSGASSKPKTLTTVTPNDKGGLELPIDHFHLLGVSASTEREAVLRTLQQRLDRVPDAGFTQETLQARSELLHSSAELLSDEERREHYERELTAIAEHNDGSIAALEIPPSREVGGLLLLMEAGQAQEAFDAASRGLQPPQAPALGSSREADLTLLAGLACQRAASDLRDQRRYEGSARLLQQGLQLLQRMGKLPEQRQKLERQLKTLLPYRVLDLISRDLSADAARQEGILLMEQLVQQRGGLEGDLDHDFPQSEFQPFFKQIRQFLTAQEQVDLFSRWADNGSPAADFLASFVLTASGFVQRKPERIQAAYQRLLAAGQPGTEVFLACQKLLLGEVDQAQILFEAGADEALSQWAEEQSPDPLARVCAYCRDWLSREVLVGFRDIEAEVDLEAWFADRDVQTFVAQQDRIRGRSSRPPTLSETAIAAEASDSLPPWPDAEAQESPAQSGSVLDASSDEGEPNDTSGNRVRWRLLQWPALPTAKLNELPSWSLPAGAGVVVLAVVMGGWLSLRPRSTPPSAVAISVPVEVAATPQEPSKPEPLPLSAAQPSEQQIQALLQAWLDGKAAVLAGKQPAVPLDQLARSTQVAQVRNQLAANQKAGAREEVQASITDLQIREQSARRIAAAVTLRYSDKRLNPSGALLSETQATTLKNTYVFGRDGDRWRLVAYSSGH